jgi:hypothetical protein
VPSHSPLRGLGSLTSGIVSRDAEKIDAGGAVRTGSGRSIFEAGDGPPNFFVVSTDQTPAGEGIGSPREASHRPLPPVRVGQSSRLVLEGLTPRLFQKAEPIRPMKTNAPRHFSNSGMATSWPLGGEVAWGSAAAFFRRSTPEA